MKAEFSGSPQDISRGRPLKFFKNEAFSDKNGLKNYFRWQILLKEEALHVTFRF